MHKLVFTWNYKWSAIGLSLVLLLSLLSCKKSGEGSDLDIDGGQETIAQANWEVVRSFDRADSYNGVMVAQFKGQPFVSTFGQRGIAPGSEGSLSDELQSTFYYKIGDVWYIYRAKNEAIIQLKEFNNELYGIRLKQTIASRVPVISYQYEYTLFKWVNNNFSDIDKISHTQPGSIGSSSLDGINFWINQQKLHLVASVSNTIMMWQLQQNKLEKLSLANNFFSGYAVPVDNKEITFTMVSDQVINADRTETTVQGMYYNGTNFRQGNKQLFIVDGPTSTKDAFNYIALNGQLWGLGFQNRNIKSYDSGQIINGAASGQKLSGTLMLPKDGKLYTMVENDKVMGSCEAIAVFDGQSYREIKYKLPAAVDPCARVRDISEDNTSRYTLVLSNFTYYLLKAK